MNTNLIDLQGKKLKVYSIDTFIQENTNRYGYYIAVSKDKNNSINKVCDVDEQGILYIGSGILKSRLRGFYKVITKNKPRGHAGAVTYNRRKLLNEKFPPNTIKIYYKFCENKLNALAAESELQEKYENKFGDLPPLNLARAKKSDADECEKLTVC